MLVVGLAVGLAGNVASAAARLGGGFDFSATFLAASAVQFATAPFLSAGYVAALTLASRDPWWRRRLEPRSPPSAGWRGRTTSSSRWSPR